VDSVSASKRMTLAEPGYESEDLGADRNLHKLLPIIRQAKADLLKLGSKQEPLSTTAGKCSVDLGEREH
jgi:methanogenic corrinoid protein MtbC1